MANVFLGVPLYNRQLDIGTSTQAQTGAVSKNHRVISKPGGSSLIPATCNILLCEALNRRKGEGIEWFAMLHSDNEPSDFWLDVLIEQAEYHNADFISAVVPIKNRMAGHTSTGISRPGERFGLFCRLTQRQVLHPVFPGTFDIHAAADALERLPSELRIENVPREFLLCNTGCMVFRLNRPWSNQAYFDNPNAIEKQGDTYVPNMRPEDWFFSQRIAELGGKVMATKLVRVKHWGLTDFDSHEVWGINRDV